MLLCKMGCPADILSNHTVQDQAHVHISESRTPKAGIESTSQVLATRCRLLLNQFCGNLKCVSVSSICAVTRDSRSREFNLYLLCAIFILVYASVLASA
jgi:hypothetical protein